MGWSREGQRDEVCVWSCLNIYAELDVEVNATPLGSR